jgi:hypothetical protein
MSSSARRDDPQPRLVFQPVPEPNPGKVRIHLDVTVEDIAEAVRTPRKQHQAGRAFRRRPTAEF